MKQFKIDINCDVGEGIGNEAELLPLISSCNIACGGHAGDKQTMKEVLMLAKQHMVKVGAHPSYPDKANFGRVSMPMNANELIETIHTQIEGFTRVLKSEGMHMHHIKPHGALYNDIAKDAVLAETFLMAISPYKKTTLLYVPYASEIEKLANAQNFQLKREAFADRNYNLDLSLVSRKQNNALLEEPQSVLKHLVTMVKEKQVKTLNNSLVEIKADTYCIHGDTKAALQILMYLSTELPTLNIEIDRE